MNTDFNWDATSFFRRLTESNALAQSCGFRFRSCSSLEGFHDALSGLLSTKAIVAVSDTSQGYSTLDNTPHTHRIKTVFLAIRHPVDDSQARLRCIDTMRELFRQFLSVLIQEKTQLEQSRIYIDPRISFNEIDRYFFTGAAAAYFQIAITTYTDLQFNPSEWLNTPTQ